VAGDGDDVVGRHHDRVALQEARAARVDDNHVGPVLVERRADLVAPDRVAGDVQHRLVGRGDDEPRDRAERGAELAGAVPPFSAHDPHAVPLELGRDRAHVGEPALAERRRVRRLAQHRDVRRQQ